MPLSTTNTALTFEAFFKTGGLRTTGLTVTVDVINPAGTLIIDNAAATEAGQGLYTYTLASSYVTTAGLYKAIFTTATTTVDEREIIADWTVLGGNIQLLTTSGNARAGMAYLIAETRRLARAGTADFALAGMTYFSDDDVQSVLDRYRTDVRYKQMRWQPVQVAGSAEYYDAYYSLKWIERAATGNGTTVAFRVENSAGSVMGTSTYSVNYDAGVVSFTSDQRGTVYYLTGRSYNVYHAAAELCRQRAAYEATAFEWSSDNHSVKRNQVYDHYQSLANELQSKGGATIAQATRTDYRGY